MSRSISAIAQLLEETRALELLASEADIAPDRLQDYWSLSADLINLVGEIEELQHEAPFTAVDDPRLLDLTRRARNIAGRLTEMALE
jgi:hypothetical protein